MIAPLAGLALDARRITRTDDPLALAQAGAWIARNLLAIRRTRVVVDGVVPSAQIIYAQITGFDDLLAAIAAVPALVDPDGLPTGWRLALRAVGIPLLDRPAASVLASGACVLAIADEPTVQVLESDRAFHVRLAA